MNRLEEGPADRSESWYCANLRLLRCCAVFMLWMGISHGWFLKLLSCCCKMVMSAAKSRPHEEGALTLGSLKPE